MASIKVSRAYFYILFKPEKNLCFKDYGVDEGCGEGFLVVVCMLVSDRRKYFVWMIVFALYCTVC